MPVLYAHSTGRRVSQIIADLFVVSWTIACGLLGQLVSSVVAATATPVRASGDALRAVAKDIRAAADQMAGLPGIGDQLRRPFDDAAAGLDGVIVAAEHQVVLIERAALVLGWLTFLLPVFIVIAVWLPRRIRFVRQAAAAHRLLDSHADLDLFALRALTNLPLRQLAQIGDDPARAWRAGDQDAIDALARLELHRLGLSPSAGSVARAG